MISNIGKRMRMRRLIDEETGALMVVPMDHGYTLGPVKGLDNISSTVDQVFQGGASAVVVHKGLVRRLANVVPPQNGLMIHVSGSTSISPNPNYKILTGSVPEVITLGADAISCHVNVGADDDYSMLEDLAKLSEEALDFGLPLLSMTYVRNSDGVGRNDPTSLAHAARLTEELGADIVKVDATDGGKDFDEVIQGIDIPVIIAGGAKADDFNSFLQTVENCILSGASGVSVGRNIFQSDDPRSAMSKVKETIKKAVNEVGKIEILS